MHLLEVDQAVQAGLVALVGKGHVLEQQRHEGDERRLQFAHKHAVRPMVATGLNQGLEFQVQFAELGRYLVPGLLQARHRIVGQAHDDGEERIQILVLLAAAGR